ncbi:LexA regulated protein [Vibrio sp. 1-Bac 57]|uniref:LexA regulated protein n=1 Tax=Psychromonas sp. SA13A TaxID=2686346 RepID=UPI00140D2B3D|nr:LexA regulated protein [Psychromonas sp. SA13A]
MAKESFDRITSDLFANEVRRGRPKSNPHSRQVQLKINKQKQTLRDKQNGLKRIELKVDSELFEQLNKLSDTLSISRAELINKLLHAQLNQIN